MYQAVRNKMHIIFTGTKDECQEFIRMSRKEDKLNGIHNYYKVLKVEWWD